MSRTYIAFDLEATGMQPERDEVIEIGAVKFSGDRVLARWESFVRPSQPIPYKVTQLTGIRQSHVARAPFMRDVAPAFIRFVGDSPIIGQSVQLDLAMLARGGVVLKNVAWDTFELATLLVPEAAVYNLRAIAAKLGIDPEEDRAHRATADAELTMRVFLALRARIEDISLEVLERDRPGHLAQRMASAPPLSGSRARKGPQRASRPASALRYARISPPRGCPTPSWTWGCCALPKKSEGDYGSVPEGAGYEGRYPVDHTELEAILKPGGAMSQAFPQYEYRPQQVEMAKAVASAFNKGHHLIMEAGTGTGKSVGYLLPAILYALRTGERVIVSTNTINLQDQLFTKDLPLSAHRASRGRRVYARHPDSTPAFRSALLKGKSNYICLRRWYLFRRNPPASIEQLRVMVKVLIWMPETNTGDRNELLLLNQESDVWGQVCVSEEGCPLYECRVRQKGLCFFDRARRQAYSAHVLVINHALLMADLAMGGGLLPEYDHLIIDEAHNLEEEATDALGFTVNRQLVMQPA